MVYELGEGWAKETQAQSLEQQMQIITRMKELSDSLKEMIRERPMKALEEDFQASPLSLKREDQNRFRDQIYIHRTGMQEKLNWLRTRVDRLVETVDKLYPAYRKADRTKKGKEFLQNPGGNSLKKEEVAFMEESRRSGLLDVLNEGALEYLEVELEKLET